MIKMFAVALAFGAAPTGRLVVGTWVAESAENAAACVTATMIQETGVKDLLQGVACHEITPDRIEQFLQQKREYDEAQKKAAPQVVQLVPPEPTAQRGLGQPQPPGLGQPQPPPSAPQRPHPLDRVMPETFPLNESTPAETSMPWPLLPEPAE